VLGSPCTSWDKIWGGQNPAFATKPSVSRSCRLSFRLKWVWPVVIFYEQGTAGTLLNLAVRLSL